MHSLCIFSSQLQSQHISRKLIFRWSDAELKRDYTPYAVSQIHQASAYPFTVLHLKLVITMRLLLTEENRPLPKF